MSTGARVNTWRASRSARSARSSAGSTRAAVARSWAWSAAQRPMGLCLPANASDLAEWRWNLVGEVVGLLAQRVRQLGVMPGQLQGGGLGQAHHGTGDRGALLGRCRRPAPAVPDVPAVELGAVAHALPVLGDDADVAMRAS